MLFKENDYLLIYYDNRLWDIKIASESEKLKFKEYTTRKTNINDRIKNIRCENELMNINLNLYPIRIKYSRLVMISGKLYKVQSFDHDINDSSEIKTIKFSEILSSCKVYPSHRIGLETYFCNGNYSTRTPSIEKEFLESEFNPQLLVEARMKGVEARLAILKGNPDTPECPVCYENTAIPHFFECDHPICECCYDKLHTSKQCPYCISKTGVLDIPEEYATPPQLVRQNALRDYFADNN